MLSIHPMKPGEMHQTWCVSLLLTPFRALGILLLLTWLATGTTLHAQGTWTNLTNSNPAGGNGTMMLLPDGTVMVLGPGVTNVWSKLHPDSAGNYINGTWTSMASMGLERLYFASNLLPNGKVFVLGGEYSGPFGFQNWDNTGEMYDPIANTWSPITPFPHSQFGDDPSVVLSDGRILCGYLSSALTYIYDPAANLWTQTGTKLRGDVSDEETWILLPDGSILSYDIFASDSAQQGSAQRYVQSTGKWVDAGKVPVLMSNLALGYELGPGGLLPDGRVLQIGANNLTAIYTPSTNKWVAGPTLPKGMGCDDAPGAMLPDGNYLLAADTSAPLFTGPTRLYQFDYTTNSITDVTPAGNLGGALASSAYVMRMLMLPNGHLLFNPGDGSLWDYAPAAAPQTAWRPTITNISKVSGNTYLLTGSQLTGISEGACYGDDAEMATNYPIVRLKDTKGKVVYARTSNWTPSVATGSRQTTCNFTLPSTIANGTYALSVSANGISSTDHSFVVGATTINPSNVIAVYTASTKTLTLTGDANANTITVSLQAGILKVEGANQTTVNSTTSVQYNVTGKFVLNADMGNGDDAISVIGVDVSTSNIELGPGNDKAAFTLSNFGTLTIDGGPGIDTLLTTSTTVGTLVKTGFP